MKYICIILAGIILASPVIAHSTSKPMITATKSVCVTIKAQLLKEVEENISFAHGSSSISEEVWKQVAFAQAEIFNQLCGNVVTLIIIESTAVTQYSVKEP